MTSIIKPTIILVIVAFFSSFVLSHIKRITEPNILRQQKEKQERALSLVLPGYTVTAEKKFKVKKKEFRYWIAEKKDADALKKAYAFIAASPGYSGDIRSMVGVDEAGTILGLSILGQSETPGLGARCEEVATSVTFIGALQGKKAPADEITQPWFQYQFNGLSLSKPIEIVKMGDWNLAIKDSLIEKNSITAITGATITGKTVIKSLNEGKSLLEKALKSEGSSQGEDTAQ